MTKCSSKFFKYKIKALFFLYVVVSSCADNNIRTNDVFRYNEHKNISGLDPAFAKDNADIWAVHQLFNGLVQMDDNMNIKPCIASTWDISDDGIRYTFELRKDVLYHRHKQFGAGETRAVTAEDFVYSFQRLKDPNLASPGAWAMGVVKEFKALNQSTFEIELKHPFPAFLGMLSMKYFSVVPKEIVDFYGMSFRANPIGTGPFKFKHWSENNKLVFRKNAHYF